MNEEIWWVAREHQDAAAFLFLQRWSWCLLQQLAVQLFVQTTSKMKTKWKEYATRVTYVTLCEYREWQQILVQQRIVVLHCPTQNAHTKRAYHAETYRPSGKTWTGLFGRWRPNRPAATALLWRNKHDPRVIGGGSNFMQIYYVFLLKLNI